MSRTSEAVGVRPTPRRRLPVGLCQVKKQVPTICGMLNKYHLEETSTHVQASAHSVQLAEMLEVKCKMRCRNLANSDSLTQITVPGN